MVCSVLLHLSLTVTFLFWLNKKPAETEPRVIERAVQIALFDSETETWIKAESSEQATLTESSTQVAFAESTKLPTDLPKLPTEKQQDDAAGFAPSVVSVANFQQIASGQDGKGWSLKRTAEAIEQENLAIEQERLEMAAKADIGPPATIEVMGEKLTGHRFIFLIDCSKSMTSRIFDYAKSELFRGLEKLDSNHRFQIVTYNDSTRMIGPRRLLRPSTENIKLAKRTLELMVASKGTNHELALYSALSKSPDVLLMITDGGLPYLNDSQIDQIVEFGGKAKIYTVQVGDKEESGFLEKLSQRSGGKYRAHR